jgi:hypothetical protein
MCARPCCVPASSTKKKGHCRVVVCGTKICLFFDSSNTASVSFPSSCVEFRWFCVRPPAKQAGAAAGARNKGNGINKIRRPRAATGACGTPVLSHSLVQLEMLRGVHCVYGANSQKARALRAPTQTKQTGRGDFRGAKRTGPQGPAGAQGPKGKRI